MENTESRSCWSLRACDFNSVNEHISILDAVWLFIGPFTTVGYGDLTPATYCGRGVAAIASTIGILVAALLTAVVAEKLALSRWEKYVHNFVLNSELAKQRTHQAANVLIYAWKMWYLKKMNEKRSTRYITVQRKFFESIYIIKQIKEKQRKLTDNCVGLAELMLIHRETSITIDETVKQMSTMKSTRRNFHDCSKSTTASPILSRRMLKSTAKRIYSIQTSSKSLRMNESMISYRDNGNDQPDESSTPMDYDLTQ
ncbi:unnamed protein product [Rotaria sp. Silwood1]|nr:unnamed protein product [Rotaria sp. Silwood1]